MKKKRKQKKRKDSQDLSAVICSKVLRKEKAKFKQYARLREMTLSQWIREACQNAKGRAPK